MRLQIAITAICSLKICQIALNESVKDRNVYEDASFAYVVKEGTVEFNKNGKQSYAAVNHGLAPQNAGYEYYMLKDKSAASAVAAESPVQILRKDSNAHMIKRDGDICAALFTAGYVYEGCMVQSVNVPLAYILGSLTLS